MEPVINLRATLDCGQVFHWRERGDGAWEGLVGDHHAVVCESSGRLQVLEGKPRVVFDILHWITIWTTSTRAFLTMMRCLQPWTFAGG